MKTLFFKVWLVVAFFMLNYPKCIDEVNNIYEQDAVVINVNRSGNYVAFMNGQKEIMYYYNTDGWTDGDAAIIRFNADKTVIEATRYGAIWRYDNNGTFTNVAYPWYMTGNRPKTVHTLTQ